MTALILALYIHGHCANVPAIAWDYPEATVLAYAKKTYNLNPAEMGYLHWCILHSRPGGGHDQHG